MRFLTALSGAIENGIPVLVRAGVVTVSWLSRFLHVVEDGGLRLGACSILMPPMLKSLNFDRALEERVLASSSLLNLVKASGTCPVSNYCRTTSFPSGMTKVNDSGTI